MENTIAILIDGTLYVESTHGKDAEQYVEELAEAKGFSINDCAWSAVHSLYINL